MITTLLVSATARFKSTVRTLSFEWRFSVGVFNYSWSEIRATQQVDTLSLYRGNQRRLSREREDRDEQRTVHGALFHWLRDW